MAIDYRKEVDSGYDRKRIVEANVVALLKAGIPVSIISRSPAFNPRHFEMVNNLKKGYVTKEEQLLQMYGGYSKDLEEQIVPDIYSGVSHPIGGELYPMTDDEEKEKFSLRDSYIEKIEEMKKKEIKRLGKEKEEAEQALSTFKIQYPIIDRIIALYEELGRVRSTEEVTLEYPALFQKYGLNIQELDNYNNLYQHYQSLNILLKELTSKYELALTGKSYSLELQELIYEKNELEAEIIQRNTKLVNGFIRQKYGYLLVETDELFQVCYIAMWEAVKIFDYKLGNSFSTLAYKYMDIAVKKQFKELTGYSWDNYWGKKKVETILKVTSKMLGHSVSISELLKYGLIDERDSSTLNYAELMEEHNLSDVFQMDQKSYAEYEFDSSYELYHGDDEVDDFETGRVIQTVDSKNRYDSIVFKDAYDETFKVLLSGLKPNERTVIIARYGLDGERPQSLSELGKVLNISPERVRSIEGKALRKMRDPILVVQFPEILQYYGLSALTKRVR